jgi:hypothetical protein
MYYPLVQSKQLDDFLPFKRNQMSNAMNTGLNAPNEWTLMRSGDVNNPLIWLKDGFPTRFAPNNTLVSGRPNLVIPKGLTLTVNATATVNTVYSLGSIVFDSTARTLTVNNDFLIYGTLNMSTSNAAHNLVLRGVNNFINNSLLFTGTGSTITFSRNGFQDILPISYRNLQLQNSTKYLIANLTIAGNLLVNTQCSFNLANYDLTVNGTSTFSSTSSIVKTSAGNIVFVGTLQATQSTTLICTDSSSQVELRGGLSPDQFTATIYNLLLTGNQSISSNYATINVQNLATISANTIVTITDGVYSGSFNVNQINGTDGTSQLRIGTNAAVNFTSTLSQMSTGIFSYKYTSTSRVGYTFNGNYTLPFNDYSSLRCTGTGIKSISSNTTINNLQLDGGSIECSTYDFTVNLGTAINSNGVFSKNGAGSVLFIGTVAASGTSTAINLTGNPTIEFRGGFNLDLNVYDFGTGDLKFTTNNQTISSKVNLNNNIIIDNVKVSMLSNPGAASNTFNGIINGTTGSSYLENKSITGLDYKNSTALMTTGAIQFDNFANLFRYNKLGNQDVTAGTYRSLIFGGSGVKKLLGNVVVNVTAGGSWSITLPATIDYNGFTITTI